MEFKKLLEQLKADEGFSPVSFWDFKQWTWGYGTKAPGPEYTIDRVDAERELIFHTVGCLTDFYDIFGKFDVEINEVRKRALINMIYNLGRSGVLGFKKMIAAIAEGDWDEAANQAKDSKWFSQVGKRAQRIVRELRTGKEV